jgi:HTH-type transcriptional regulator / antitoxin HipB
MVYAIEELTGKLRAVRKKKGMSQRAFAKSIGMPQSRLSKIENGIIDLQVSNMLELARSLDLDLMLIPRQMVPAVNSLVRQATGTAPETEMTAIYDLSAEEDDDG